jgi:hypothetical protein
MCDTGAAWCGKVAAKSQALQPPRVLVMRGAEEGEEEEEKEEEEEEEKEEEEAKEKMCKRWALPPARGGRRRLWRRLNRVLRYSHSSLCILNILRL